MGGIAGLGLTGGNAPATTTVVNVNTDVTTGPVAGEFDYALLTDQISEQIIDQLRQWGVEKSA